jgi:hypothetical protein
MPPTLPAEIWLFVAELLTIGDIEALSLVRIPFSVFYSQLTSDKQTCRALHTWLPASLALWRAIVKDLLVISPNPLLSRSLLSETAQSLFWKALRFHHTNRILSGNGATRIPSAREVVLPEGAQLYAIQIVPGTTCAIYISVSGSIRLVCLSTGTELDVWRPPKPNLECTSGLIYLYASAKYGLVAAILVRFGIK